MLLIVNAGYQDLSSNIWLNWTFTDSTTAVFFIGVRSTIYQSDKWVGIGIKSDSEETGMANADIVSFYMGSTNNCQDRYSITNAVYPPIDTQDDITCYDRIKDGNTYLYGWERDLTTGDSSDFAIVKDNRVMIIWAQGPMSGGDISYHGSGDDERGHQIIYLEEDYYNGQSFGLLLSIGLVILSSFLV